MSNTLEQFAHNYGKFAEESPIRGTLPCVFAFVRQNTICGRLADYSGLGELSLGFQESHRATQRFAISHVQAWRFCSGQN
jgi:hypothetical protein